MLPLTLISLGSLFGILVSLSCSLLKHIIVAAVCGQLEVMEVDNVCTYGVQEVSSVTDHQQRFGPSQQVVLRKKLTVGTLWPMTATAVKNWRLVNL